MTREGPRTPVLSLLVDGRPLPPAVHAGAYYVFRLSLPAREIRLISGAARPVDLGRGPDVRWRGVFVRGIEFRQGEQTSQLPFSLILRSEGFYSPMRNGLWTNGNALLPEALVPAWRGDVELSVEIDGGRKRAAFASSTPPPLHPVLGAFESLGQDCEFAFAQKHFDSRIPPGLLSWARIEYDKLIEGLDADFDGVDDPATSSLIWKETEPDRGEYRLLTRYFRAHTGQDWQSTPEELAGMLDLYCGRMRMLRRKFLRDLAAPRRIMVYVAHDGDMGRERIMALHAALRRHGPAVLLYVAAGTAHLPGPRVENLAEGVYLARFGERAGWRGPYDPWLETCREALQFIRQQQPTRV